MKIGIITFHKAINYGAVLQAYGLYHYLSMCGHQVELINYDSHIYDRYNIYKKRNLIKNIAYKLLIAPNERKRRNKFYLFVNSLLSISDGVYSPDNIKNIFKKENHYYDVIITGSDQVWNPLLINNEGAFLLDFVGSDTKRVSYAASIGLETLSTDILKWYKYELQFYFGISVRESQASKILQTIGIDSTVVCDPALLLAESEWEKVEHWVNTPSKYILIYAFGSDTILWDCAKILSRANDFRVCVIGNSLIPNWQAKQYRGIGPSEWLYLIRNAQCVLTNSYHGLVFSLIFKKDFWISDPKDGTASRIFELLNRVGYTNRAISSADFLDINSRIDYGPVTRCLSSFVKDSTYFLWKILK